MEAVLTQAVVIRLVQTKNESNDTGGTALQHGFLKVSLQYEEHEGREHLNSTWDDFTGYTGASYIIFVSLIDTDVST